MKQFAVCWLLCCTAFLSAQIGGDATFRFLELSNSPRQLALGDPISLQDMDISTTLANPAMIRGEHGGQVMVNYEPYYDGISRGTAAYAYAFNRQKALVFDVNYINYGTFDGADPLGNPTGRFTGSEVALGIASSHYFIRQNIYLGARLRYTLSNLEAYTSTSLSGDMGLYYSPVTKPWRIALVYQHIGSQLTAYEDVFEPLPANLSLGFSSALKYLPLRWHLTFHHLNKYPLYFDNPVDASQTLGGGTNQKPAGLTKKLLRHASFGVEVFPASLFSIRLGYHAQRAAELRILELRNFSGLSFGVGMQLRRLRFQISHARYNVAGNRTFLGLTLEPRR
jgi:hypothetical protein